MKISRKFRDGLKSLTIFGAIDFALIFVLRWPQQALKLALGHKSSASNFCRDEYLVCDPPSGGPKRHPGEPHDVAGTQIFWFVRHSRCSALSLLVSAGAGAKTANSAAAWRARRRTSAISASVAADWLFLTDVEPRWRITIRICRAGESKSKWPNRSQFCAETPIRIVRTRLRHASSENSIFSGMPAAWRKRIRGPAAIPSLGRLGPPTEVAGSLPVIVR